MTSYKIVYLAFRTTVRCCEFLKVGRNNKDAPQTSATNKTS